jgi:hypothetical protein
MHRMCLVMGKTTGIAFVSTRSRSVAKILGEQTPSTTQQATLEPIDNCFSAHIGEIQV